VSGIAAQAAIAIDNARLYARVQESEQRFRQLAERVTDVFWITDAREPRLLYISPAYEKVWGLSCQTLYANPDSFVDAVHPDDRERVLDSMARQRRGETTAEQYRVIHPDGSVRWVWDRGYPIRGESGELERVAGVAEDITERKLAEQRLKDSEERLKEADRRKDEFLATLSHELRNPLAPLRHTLEIIKRAGDDASVLRQSRDTMDRQVGQMARLIDDLLDVSRITHDKLELRKESVDLAAVVHQAVETSRPLIEDCGHTLVVCTPDEPVWLHADGVRIAQVLGNLLSNACKYMAPGGEVRLTTERQQDEVVLSVQDHGEGIASDQLESIFEMFTQADRSLERSQGGLGIGLTLVKRLVEMHGGSVQAFSDGTGTGSEFVVRLPVATEGLQAEGPARRAVLDGVSPTRARRVLVVDDNRDSAASLAMLLTLDGHDTRSVHDGPEAISVAESFRPDVVLLDLGLPKMNGYEVCRTIRRKPWGKSIAMIALTGWGQETHRRRSRNAGFDHHLVKPVDHAAIEALLASLPPTPSGEQVN
jgi:PAS domain S-box-containing protein